jgi:hypothetical protein
VGFSKPAYGDNGISIAEAGEQSILIALDLYGTMWLNKIV